MSVTLQPKAAFWFTRYVDFQLKKDQNKKGSSEDLNLVYEPEKIFVQIDQKETDQGGIVKRMFVI